MSNGDMLHVREIEDLMERASLLIDDGDRVAYYLQASGLFEQSQNTSMELIFNVPADADFHGKRLNFYLAYRVINNAAPVSASELTYRPGHWSNEVPGASDPRDCSALVVIRDSATGDFQNAGTPITIASFYSTKYWISGQNDMPITEHVGGFDFPIDYYLKRGSTLTARITPIFSRNDAVATERRQYKVFGVFQGYKKMKAFK